MPDAYLWQAFFETLYPVWGIIGVMVAFNYGKAAHADWRTEAGTWGHAFIEWMAIAWFVVWGCARDVVHLVTLRPLPVEPPLFTRRGYSPGHLLRFFIMLSFFTSAIFGFMLRTIDRSEWGYPQLIATAVAVLASVTAGLGHLFIAWRFHPRRWRWTAFVLVGAVPVALVIRIAF